MANEPTQGIFLPNKLNACNTPWSTGAADPTGTQVLPTGLTPYKVIMLGFTEAQNLQVGPPSGEQLYEGAYQWVQVDSGAVAIEVNTGLAAYYKLPNPAAPVTALTTITSESAVSPVAGKNLFAGVFLNPITPGNWGFIFAGAGRVNVTFRQALTNGSPAQGDVVNVGGGQGTFDDGSATTVVAKTIGYATVAPTANGTSPIDIRGLIYRIAS